MQVVTVWLPVSPPERRAPLFRVTPPASENKTRGPPGPIERRSSRTNLMQVLSHYRDDACIPLGQRRGISDLARFSLDLNGARADSASAAHSGGYPSPPMSGSPPLPPKLTQEAADRSQGVYQTIAQDGTYRGIPPTQGGARYQPTALTRPPPAARPTIGGELQGRMHFPFPRPESAAPRSLSYPPQPNHVPVPAAPSYLPPLTTGLSPSSASQPYPVVAQPPPLEGSSQQQTSPKTQRKTKGHVLSLIHI